jgi:hypothetical protein
MVGDLQRLAWSIVMGATLESGFLLAEQAHRDPAADQSRLEPVFVVAGRCAPIKDAQGRT